jgi:Ca2+-binding EF-hand superfamily protein
MKHYTLVTGLAATLLAFGAHAGDYSKKASFESLDKDGNGQITATEATSHEKLSKKMAQLDKDGDGSLSKTEFESMQVAEAETPASGAQSTPSAMTDGDKRSTETAPTTAAAQPQN